MPVAKQIIAVDADDTLFDENNAVRLFHNDKYGTQHAPEDYLVAGDFWGYWRDVWGVDADEETKRYEEFIAYKLQHNLPPLPGALEVLQQLKEQYELVVVTFRDERAVTMTHQALTEHYPEVFGDVHFVPLWGDGKTATKAQICNEIGAAYLIDDTFETGKLAAESGVKSLLFGDYGWNRTQPLLEGMTRVKDWPAVKEYFDGQR